MLAEQRDETDISYVNTVNKVSRQETRLENIRNGLIIPLLHVMAIAGYDLYTPEFIVLTVSLVVVDLCIE